MALGLRRGQPNMSYAQFVNIFNENMDMLDNVNKTQIIKDDTGTARIIIGRFPNGEYGIIMSKEGKNVLEYEDFV